jgi:murein DD-endopeptidase MepM/ murein hydrolase activator NlpD
MDKSALLFLRRKNLVIFAKLIVLVVIIISLILLIMYKNKPSQSLSNNKNQPLENTAASTSPIAISTSSTNLITTSASSSHDFFQPISGALGRVTKKPFSLYVSPKNSPVNPEHFSGYHTGVDFETTAQEQNGDVPIYAICPGSLMLKKIATGYGGVAVQSCQIFNEPVTIIYGHLRFTSITAQQGTLLKKGQQIGFLGKGYSTETAGERKHLHLGIHKGSKVDLLGYVTVKSELSQWIDFLTLMK